MTDQLKPKAWLIDDRLHCTGIEVACDERADVIEYWKEEGKATPLYAIPEGYTLVKQSDLLWAWQNEHWPMSLVEAAGIQMVEGKFKPTEEALKRLKEESNLLLVAVKDGFKPEFD